MSHDAQKVRSFEHPGEGQKRAKSTPKGRQVDPQAAEEIALLLGDRPRRRDLLIEHLHLIQDTWKQISASHLAALADEMKLSFAEVFETATFYAHFDVVKEGEASVPPLTIRVCDSLTCAMLGGERLLHELQTTAGPGIRTGRKWRAVLGEPGPRLMAVNGDEGEPGTFKDRFYLLRDLHRFLEGTLIGAHIVDATDVYIYIRDEYPAALKVLPLELAKLPKGGPTLHIRRGAGAYICGEESSLLESIEGKRGLPRHKPPYPFQVGLFGLPTLINNIETLFWVRDIVEKRAAWWRSP